MNLLKIALVLLVICNIQISYSAEIPANAYASGSNWFCNTGYKKLGNKCNKINVPVNAYASGSNWFCNTGYKKLGNKCNKINVPANAYASGSNWFCNTGYKKHQNQCIEMNAVEKQRQKKAIVAMRSKSRNKNIEGQSFSLRDIESKCEAYKYSDSYGDIECSGSEFRIIERKCEAYFSESNQGEMECSGELRSINGDCSIDMYSDNYGELSC